MAFAWLRTRKETINQHFYKLGLVKKKKILTRQNRNVSGSPSRVWKHARIITAHVNPKHGASLEYRTPGVTASQWRRGDCYCSDCSVIGGCARARARVCVGGCVCVVGGSVTADWQLEQVNSVCGGIQEDGGLFITCSSDMCFCITHTAGKCEEIGLYQERHQIIVFKYI